MIYDVKPYVDLLKRLAPQAKRLTLDSRKIQDGDVFIGLPGLKTDGRNYLQQAAQKAQAVVFEDDGEARSLGIASIAVPDLNENIGQFASEFYDHPSQRMQGIAITGTNGKTTSSHWLGQLLSALGRPCAAIGTIGCMFNGKPFDSAALTTPDAVSLQTTLAQVQQAGAQAFAVEASSIGLEQGRLNGTRLQVGVFTNLTRDHLDYHKSMQAYEKAKRILFDWPTLQAAVINMDDPVGVEFAQLVAHRGLHVILTTINGALSLPGTSLLSASNIVPTQDGLGFDLTYGTQVHHVQLGILGEFNVSNLLGVIGAALACGFSLDEIVAQLQTLVPPPGRMQRVVEAFSPLVVVDYSHTPDAVQKALQALRPVVTKRGGELWIIVGAGGDRDPGKRPMMAACAQRYADRVVLTSDNPRSEDPAEILAQMAKGVDSEVMQIVSREEAIVMVMNMASEKDVVLIAGKGHEEYQEIHGVKYPFSDVIQARNALRMKNKPTGSLMSAKQLSMSMTQAEYFGTDVPFSDISTDTRTCHDGSLFFALKGERFDAHDFVNLAMHNGAVALVVERRLNCPLPQIVVPDTKRALGESAAYWRRHKAIRVIAVAGSNGKTTTTQMIASILKTQYGDAALFTQGNLNNDIGVPLTLWRLRDTHEVAVVETGMNHIGEMQYLTDMVRPNVAVITNAQREHQEFLKTVEASARENGRIFEGLMPAGYAVYPADDACAGIWDASTTQVSHIRFARDSVAEVTGNVQSLSDGILVQIQTEKGLLTAKISVLGEHNLSNAMAATAAALSLNLSLATIKQGLETFKPVNRRGELTTLSNGTVMIDDTYNANPDSMRAAIDVLARQPAPRMLVIGDMGEVGENSERYHAEIGTYAAQKGIEKVLATGGAMQAAVQAYNEQHCGGSAQWIQTRLSFTKAVLSEVVNHRTVLLKASNYMKLNEVVQAIKENQQ